MQPVAASEHPVRGLFFQAASEDLAIPCPWQQLGGVLGREHPSVASLLQMLGWLQLQLPIFMAVSLCSASRLFYGSLCS